MIAGGLRWGKASGWLVGILVVGLGLAGWAWWTWWGPAPVLPVIAFEEVEPRVAEVIREQTAQLAQNPRSAESWGRLGKVLFANGLNEPALECFEKAARLDPRDPRWPYYQGIYYSIRDTSRAEQLLRQALERSERTAPDNLAPRLRLVELLLGMGKLEEAETTMQPLLSRGSNDPHVLYVQGLLAFHRQQWREALDYFLPLRQHLVGSRLVSGPVAMIYQRLNEPARAEEFARLAAKLSDRDVTWDDDYVTEYTSMNLGKRKRLREVATIEEMVGPREAMQTIQQLLREEGGNDPTVYDTLGENLMKQQQFAMAARAFGRSLQLAPARSRTRYSLSVALAAEGDRLRKTGQPAEARKCYEEAVQAVRQALGSDFRDAWVQYQLGRCLLELGQAKEAIGPLKQAVISRPETARFHCFLAAALAESGEKEEARRSLERGLSIAPPDDSVVKEIQQRLEAKWQDAPTRK